MYKNKQYVRLPAVRRAAVFFLVLLIISGTSTAALADSGEARMLIPVGRVVGIKMAMDGILVTGLPSVETAEGAISPSASAGVLPGDVILRVGSVSVTTASEFITAASELTGDPITLTVRRGEKVTQYTVTPARNTDGVLQLGLWLKDGVEGIGTVTFYDIETGCYGALGHGITDSDSGIIMPLSSGSVFSASVLGVKKGQCGTPGELCGCFDIAQVLGSISVNSPSGIFGTLGCAPEASLDALPAATTDEISTGPATILANIQGGEVREYDIEITRVNKGSKDERCLLVSVTDPDLLALTGGIVQGMSGSPIIQNGRIVGAVTHVLVNDPTKGYGITIEKMLSAAGLTEETSVDFSDGVAA